MKSKNKKNRAKKNRINSKRYLKNNNSSIQPGVLVVIGEQDLLTKIGRCCNPIHGDEIIGYLTRNQDVTVHKTTCNNAKYSLKPEKIVDVNWGEYTTREES